MVRINADIRVANVRLVDSEGEQIGIMPTAQALEVADEQDLDLVEVSPEADPPVCRIMDYGKYKFKQRTRKRQAKKHQRIVVLKEIRMRPKIESHDFGFKVDHIRKFLNHGDRVRVTIQFRGREMAHPELGNNLLARVVEELGEIAIVDHVPKREGRVLFLMLSPAPSHGGKDGKKSKSGEEPKE
jgi:translation initiation factor IF-3